MFTLRFCHWDENTHILIELIKAYVLPFTFTNAVLRGRIKPPLLSLIH